MVNSIWHSGQLPWQNRIWLGEVSLEVTHPLGWGRAVNPLLEPGPAPLCRSSAYLPLRSFGQVWTGLAQTEVLAHVFSIPVPQEWWSRWQRWWSGESGSRNRQNNWTSRGLLNQPVRPSASFGKNFQHLCIHPSCLQSSCSTCCHAVLNTAGQRMNGTLRILITSRESLWQRHLNKRKSDKISSQAPFPPSLVQFLILLY